MKHPSNRRERLLQKKKFELKHEPKTKRQINELEEIQVGFQAQEGESQPLEGSQDI